MSNNPPSGVTLELSAEQAKFLLDNCNANITCGLGALTVLKSYDLLEKIITQIEHFKEMRTKLIAQGVISDDGHDDP